MASGSGSSSSTLTRSTPQWKYHAFLSFRGKDTRRNFTGYLYSALQRRGIMTFRDDEELERGEFISDQLIKAIEESMFSIVVLSQGYASSSWCLTELQQIVKSKQHLGQIVFPVFYEVDPSDFRHQKGDIGKALEKHEGRFPKDKVRGWREALTDVANLSGWDTRNKNEATIIDEIAEGVWAKLRVRLPYNLDHLVGIQSKIDRMVSLLKIGLDKKYFIAIWGMGGIGKTTLARVVYEAIQNKFETSCFLTNVRERSLEGNGLVGLQEKLLSCLHLKDKINDSYEGVQAIRNFFCNRKVLIVLDDISHISQLENLAGNEDWFGEGSRIIITTRDIQLLTQYDHFEEYNIEILNNEESLELLCQKAFKKDYPEEGYLELSEEVVEYAGGLPLALKVLGSFLCKRSQSEWRNTLDKMKKSNLPKDILKILRISFEGLEDDEYKTIFLDIACFFNWKSKSEVTRILENCGLHPTIAIQVLMEKTLLSCDTSKDGKECLYMHDLLQDMGRIVVLQESPNDAGRRSRHWSTEEIDLVLRRNMGSKRIQSIYLNLQEKYETNWHRNCFSKMHNLKLLNLSNVHLSQSLSSLSSALKVLIWKRCSLEGLPHINQLYELVELDLSESKIRHLWNGTLFLDKLKFINLSYSKDLIEMPDCSGIPNLESLFLKRCIGLVKVHDSIGLLKKLVKLNLKGCVNLVTFPEKLEMNSLKEFVICGCSKLKKLPEFGESMKSLSILKVRSTNITKLPFSITHLTNLQELYLQHWLSPHRSSRVSSLEFDDMGRISILVGQKFFNSISSLFWLRKLNLSSSNLWDELLPHDLSSLSSLEELDLSRNNFVNLPAGFISKLANLKRLNLSLCCELESLPELPPNLRRVDASGIPSIITPEDFEHLCASLLSKNRKELIIKLTEAPMGIIAAWFTELEYSIIKNDTVISIATDIPDYVESEWSGIVVYLELGKTVDEPFWKYCCFDWSFRSLEDGNFDSNEVERSKQTFPFFDYYLAFFPFNEENCGRDQRANHSRIELQFASLNREGMKGPNLGMLANGGWIMRSKEDVDVYNTSAGCRRRLGPPRANLINPVEHLIRMFLTELESI